MTALLEKELKIVQKYSVEIRDHYEEFLEKKQKLSDQLDEELRKLRINEMQNKKM